SAPSTQHPAPVLSPALFLDHPPPGSRQIGVGELGEADKLVACGVLGIAREKVGHVWVVSSAEWCLGKMGPQAIGLGKPDDSRSRQILIAEARGGQLVHPAMKGLRSLFVPPRIERPPENRQKAIRSEAGGEKKPP